jgi:phosphate/sulfate permease
MRALLLSPLIGFGLTAGLLLLAKKLIRSRPL